MSAIAALLALYYLDNIVLIDTSLNINELDYSYHQANAWGAIGAAVGNLASNIAGPLIQQRTAVKTTNMANRARRRLAEYSYSKDLEMWERQNQYNSPSAQMKRLKQAGLNPAMVYGQGSQTANIAREMPQYQTPQVGKPQAFNLLAGVNFLDIATAVKNLQIMEEQRRNIRQQRGNLVTENTLKALEAEKMGVNIPYRQRQTMYQNMLQTQEQSMMEQKSIRRNRRLITEIEAEMAQRYQMSMKDRIQWRMLMKILDTVGLNPF